jgi:hypothetical protein
MSRELVLHTEDFVGRGICSERLRMPIVGQGFNEPKPALHSWFSSAQSRICRLGWTWIFTNGCVMHSLHAVARWKASRSERDIDRQVERDGRRMRCPCRLLTGPQRDWLQNYSSWEYYHIHTTAGIVNEKKKSREFDEDIRKGLVWWKLARGPLSATTHARRKVMWTPSEGYGAREKKQNCLQDLDCMKQPEGGEDCVWMVALRRLLDEPCGDLWYRAIR